MQAIPQWYYFLKSSLIGRHALGRYELFEICHKTPVAKHLQFFWPPTKEFSVWKGLTYTVYCFILSGHPKVPRRKYCPKLRHLRLAGVAMREEPSDPPPSGTVFISSPLIHNWPWSLPSILTLSIPLYCLQILWVSLAAPLSTGAVTEQKMTIPRRNPILTGFMAEQAAGRSCWMLLYFSFGLVGGILNWALWCVELNAECLSTQPWS